MSQPPPPPPPPPLQPPLQPPALPTRPQEKKALGHLGKPQVIFDTVTGPNLRLRDNLIQLASVILAVLIAIPISYLFTRELPLAIGIGLITGLIGGILISGAALGLFRFIKGVSRK